VEINIILDLWSKTILRDFFLPANGYQHCPPAPMAAGLAVNRRAISLSEAPFSPALFFNVILTF
jgi:hypothetical protein